MSDLAALLTDDDVELSGALPRSSSPVPSPLTRARAADVEEAPGPASEAEEGELPREADAEETVAGPPSRAVVPAGFAQLSGEFSAEVGGQLAR